MYKLLGGLKDYFKAQEVQIDNAVFRLHNVFTTVLLLACSLVITATQYVGQPISCIVNGIPPHVVNTYCWISSTFTMPDAFQRQVKIKFYSFEFCSFSIFLDGVRVYFGAFESRQTAICMESAHTMDGERNDTYFCYTQNDFTFVYLLFVCLKRAVSNTTCAACDWILTVIEPNARSIR